MVTQGRSELDPQMLTGETLPEPVAPGSRVVAGMTNLTGLLQIRVESLGEDTVLAQMTALIETAETAKNRYSSLAERAAKFYAPVVHLLALGALLGWGGATGDWRLAVNIAAATLIITCPCALGLAVPAVLTAASGRLFRAGVLLKDGLALERLASIDMVIFDKTGTLTTGSVRLTNGDEIAPQDFALAAALASGSRHPLARALAGEWHGDLPRLTDVEEHPGEGVAAQWDGRTVRLGRADWVGAARGEATETVLRVEGQAPVHFRFKDDLRPEAADVIATLKEAGKKVVLLSGDAPGPVSHLAETLGIDTALARQTPADKSAYLQAQEAAGQQVLMVGDGLNDTAALAGASVSAAPARAVDAARTAADLVLLRGDLSAIPQAMSLARRSRSLILQNFAIAAIYNAVSIPLALAGFVTPLIAAIAMSASSITVTLNALRVRL